MNQTFNEKEIKMTNQPAFKLRDGAITVTVWKNTTEDGKTIYNVDAPVRGYTDDNGQWKDSHSFAGGDVLRAANLLTVAHNRILDLKADA